MSLLILALVLPAEARDTRKPWVRKIEDDLSAPPTTPGSPVEGTRTFEKDDDGWRGCWQDAMYPPVETHGGVDLVDAGVVVASGWEVPIWGQNPDTPLDPTALLASRGVTLGRLLGYAPALPGPPRAHQGAFGTLYEAGNGRVVWLSHEEATIGLLWYAGERPPEALTRCLVPWEGLVTRTEAALATNDCGPIIDELYPHTWGAPTPGALPLLERCDAQWRDRFAALTTRSDPEEILSVYHYHMVRWSGPKKPLLFPTPPLKWGAHIWGPLDDALERSDVTPAQQVIFALLRRAFAGRMPVDHSEPLSPAFAAYIPRVAGLDRLGVEESALLRMHPLVAPAATWGGVSRTRNPSLALGPPLWNVADLLDESTSTLEYEGEGRRVDESYEDTDVNAAYLGWEAEEQALVNAVDVAVWSHGDCRLVTSVSGGSTRYYTGSSFDLVITGGPVVTSTSWLCPPGVLEAKAALEDHRKQKPQGQRFRYKVETTRLGWQRSTILRPALQFTIGSSDQRWALSARLESYFLELSGGARDEWPSETRTEVPVRPPLTCGREAAPEAVRPYLGGWADDRFAVRFCYDDGELNVIVVATPEGNFASAYTGEGHGLRPDGTLELSAAWASDKRPFYQKYRREGNALMVRTRSFESDWGAEQALRPMLSELPFTELTATRDYGSASDAGFTDASIRAELDIARGMLAESLMREVPALSAAFRADVLGHLRATLQGDELTRTLFLLGYPIEGDIPASVRLLDAWDRSVTEGRAVNGRPQAAWSPGVR